MLADHRRTARHTEIPRKLSLTNAIRLFQSVKTRVKSTRYRPIYKWFFWFFIFSTVALGYLGAKPPEGGYVIAARVCTFYYFAHFLIVMPLVGLFETPKALPGSILESVTGPGKQVSGSGVPAGAAAAPSTNG